MTFTDVMRDPVAIDPTPHGQPLIYDTHTGDVKAAGTEDWILSWRPGTSEALVAVDRKLALYNAETGQWRVSNVPSTFSPAYCYVWSPDGRWLLLEDNEGESHFALLDLVSLLLTRMEEHTGVSPSHEWSPRGRWVALDAWGTNDVNVHVYDLQAGLRPVGSHGGVAKRWLDDETLLVSEGNPERFTLLRVDASGVTARGSISAASFFSSVSPSGQRIADVRDPHLLLYDTRSQSARELDAGYYALGEALKAPHSYEWSPDERFLAVLVDDTTRIYSLDPPALVAAIVGTPSTFPDSGSWSANGRYFAMCNDRFRLLADMQQGGVIVDPPEWYFGEWQPVAWSPDARWAARETAAGDGEVLEVTDTSNRERRELFASRSSFNIVGWSGDSRYLAFTNGWGSKPNGERYPFFCARQDYSNTTPRPGDAFRPGQTVVVDTDGPDRMIVRERPGLSAPELQRAENGTAFVIEGGPVVVDGYTWWRFESGGWAADSNFRATSQ